MLQSHVIQVDGVFLGAAVRFDCGFRFVATDIRVKALDGTVWPSLGDIERLTQSLYRGEDTPEPPTP